MDKQIKSKIKTLAVLLASGIFISACATSGPPVQDTYAAFMGKPLKEAIAKLGKPSGTYNMQNGTWQVLWTQSAGSKVSSGSSFMGVQVTDGSSKSCSRILVVNAEKIVIDHSYEGTCKK